MEHTTDMAQMLELMDRPAFCVRDGIITAANRSAIGRLVRVGDPLSPLLTSGHGEYAEFSEGCLFLSLCISGEHYGASVTRVGDQDVFTLEAADSLGELRSLALAARELRSPLHKVMALSDGIFPQVCADPQLADQIAQMNRGLYQLHRLINNMADAATFLSPRLELRDVTAVAQELFEQAAELCQEAGVTLHFSNPPVPAYSLIDSQRLERGIYNILSNALKFAPRGSVIEAKLTRRANTLYFIIADQGPGLAAGVAPNVFSRFLREPSIEDPRFGLGLGMTLIRSAAMIHGGTVLLEQPKDGGVRVTMSLPIRQDVRSVRSPTLHVDYAGERNHGLTELADSLPHELYKPNKG